MMNIMEMMRNPQKAVEQIMMNGTGNNPVMQNLLQKAKVNDVKGVEDTARNLFKSQGRNFDSEFAAFKKRMGF